MKKKFLNSVVFGILFLAILPTAQMYAAEVNDGKMKDNERLEQLLKLNEKVEESVVISAHGFVVDNSDILTAKDVLKQSDAKATKDNQIVNVNVNEQDLNAVNSIDSVGGYTSVHLTVQDTNIDYEIFVVKRGSSVGANEKGAIVVDSNLFDTNDFDEYRDNNQLEEKTLELLKPKFIDYANNKIETVGFSINNDKDHATISKNGVSVTVKVVDMPSIDQSCPVWDDGTRALNNLTPDSQLSACPPKVSKQVTDGVEAGTNVITGNKLTYGGRIRVPGNVYIDGAQKQGQVVFKDTLDARLSNPQLVVKLDGKDITSLGATKVEGNVVTWTVTEDNLIKQIANSILTWQMVVDYTSDGTTSTVLNTAQVITTPAQMPGEPTPEPEPTPPVEVPVYPGPGIVKNNVIPNANGIIQSNGIVNYNGTLNVIDKPLKSIEFIDKLDYRLTLKDFKVTFNGVDITDKGKLTPAIGTKGAKVVWTLTDKELLAQIQGKQLRWELDTIYDLSSNDLSKVENKAAFNNTLLDGTKLEVVDPAEPVYPPNMPDPIVTPQIPTGVKVGLSSAIILVIASLALVLIKRKRK